MILTKDTTGTLSYLIPGGAVPSAISWTLYGRTGTSLLSGQSVTPPTSYTVSTAEELARNGEVALTLSATPSGIVAGDILRVRDTWGRDFDVVVFGVKTPTKQIRISDFGGDSTEIATCWNPTISLSITGTYLDETGDGWRVELSITQSGIVTKDQRWFSVALLSLNLSISPREYLDLHPEMGSDLSALEIRRDWPRLVAAAKELVEERLSTRERYYASIISSTGLRRMVVEALSVILAGSTVPANASPLEWLDRANARFNNAASDCLATAYYDVDQSGVADEDEKTPPASTSYKVL